MAITMSSILLDISIIKLSLWVFDGDFADGLALDPIRFDDLTCGEEKLTFAVEFV
jgi:hypothetical protein